MAYEQAPEEEAFSRWQDGEFLVVERQFAKTWREGLGKLDLLAMASAGRAMGISSQTCKSLADAKAIVDVALARVGDPNLIKLALMTLGVPNTHEERVLATWRARGAPSLAVYAPYAAHVVGIELFFEVAVSAGLIGTSDRNNRGDIAYLFYLPFCHVFISSDLLHKRCGPLFLRADQSFAWGPDVKADLSRLMKHFEAMPEEEREQGLMHFAANPPVDDEGVVAGLWDRHFGGRGWRSRTNDPPQQDQELIDRVNRTGEAPALSPEEVDFDMNDSDFVHISRRVSKRRGSWWQLPKNMKG